MRKIFFLILLSPVLVWSQKTAFFETTFHFVDAKGNRDSIIAGWDNDANHEYNPDFGEVALTSPFDNIFEVRAAHFWDYSPDNEVTLSKKIIGGVDLSDSLINEFQCIPQGEIILFFIHAKNFPINISWNPEAFRSKCMIRSFLSEHLIPNFSPEWTNSVELVEQTICLGDDSELLYNHRYLYKSPDFVPVLLSEEIEGIGLDSIWGIAIYIGPQIVGVSTPCNHLFVSSVSELDGSMLNIYPNPTSGLIRLDTDKMIKYQLFDINGKMLLYDEGWDIDISGQPPGIYFLKPENHQAVKIVKQ